MRKILTVAVSTTMFLFVGSVVAQDDEELTWVPVEAYACNFNDGKGPADLAAVVAEWNEWMDDEGQTEYFAITLWPSYYGERNFDVGWLGSWPNGNAMGAGTDYWLQHGQEMGAKFYEVLDCSAHTNFATAQLIDPGGEPVQNGDTFVLSFSNCSFTEDGGGMEGYLEASAQWEAYAGEHGFTGGDWMMFPTFGENVEADYDFKAVGSSKDYTAMGANWQLFAEGHWRKSSELFDPVVDCDSARVYTAMVERTRADGE